MTGTSAQSDGRVALVIGNSKYLYTSTLPNPVNDATDVAGELRNHGFKVIEGFNLDFGGHYQKVQEFSRALQDSDVSVLFYAGHGIQVAGNNYLVPTDAKLETEASLDFEALQVDMVLRQMVRQSKIKIVLLDACRDNPLADNLKRSAGASRSVAVGRGLAELRGGLGTYIAFATAPGETASDGAGRNSPFTAALKKQLRAADNDLFQMMLDIRREVVSATHGGQVPWENHAMTERFWFKPLPVVSPPVVTTARSPRLPIFHIVSPRQASVQTGGHVVLAIDLKEDQANPVNGFDVFVNGIKVVPKEIRPETTSPLPQDPNLQRKAFDVPLASGGNIVRVVARSAAGESEQVLSLTQSGQGQLDRRGTLYVLAIGIDKYPLLAGRMPPLMYAGTDARQVASAISRSLGPSHQRVVSRVLINDAGPNDEPTRRNIEDALNLMRDTEVEDTVMLFIAGHGENDARSGGYNLLPTDAAVVNGELRRSTVLPWQVIQEGLRSAKGRRFLFIDTAKAFNSYNARLLTDAADDGIVVFSASSRDQVGIENPMLAHGVFTYALLKGLSGEADQAQDGKVGVLELSSYLSAEVLRLTQGKQQIDVYKTPGAPNFVLTRPQ
jgi:uncharacterized caspase-like protein